MFPSARLGIGPPVENGCYYDFDGPQPFGPPPELEGAKYYPKAMTCPMRILIYASRGRSYRELPLRLFGGAAGIQVQVDTGDDRMQKKIRNAQRQKVPYMLLAGDRDVAAGAVSFRYRNGEQKNGVPVGASRSEPPRRIGPEPAEQPPDPSRPAARRISA